MLAELASSSDNGGIISNGGSRDVNEKGRGLVLLEWSAMETDRVLTELSFFGILLVLVALLRLPSAEKRRILDLTVRPEHFTVGQPMQDTF